MLDLALALCLLVARSLVLLRRFCLGSRGPVGRVALRVAPTSPFVQFRDQLRNLEIKRALFAKSAERAGNLLNGHFGRVFRYILLPIREILRKTDFISIVTIWFVFFLNRVMGLHDS